MSCVDRSGTLRIFDIVADRTIFEKQRFGKPVLMGGPPGDEFPVKDIGDRGVATLRFSPDSQFLIGAPSGSSGSPVVVELRDEEPKEAYSGLKHSVGNWFTFVSNDKFVTPTGNRDRKPLFHSALVGFPSGNLIARFDLPMGTLSRAADPRFVLVHASRVSPSPLSST